MLVTADGSKAQAQAAIRVDLGAIFVSLELGRSSWLVTSLSPGSEKLSRHRVAGGSLADLLACFGELRRKAEARTGELYRLVVIQEAGLDGFWLDRALKQETWIESHLLITPGRRKTPIAAAQENQWVINDLVLKRGYPPQDEVMVSNFLDCLDVAVDPSHDPAKDGKPAAG